MNPPVSTGRGGAGLAVSIRPGLRLDRDASIRQRKFSQADSTRNARVIGNSMAQPPERKYGLAGQPNSPVS